MPKMSGARFLAETLKGYGVTHVFFMPYIAPRALMEMEKLGISVYKPMGRKRLPTWQTATPGRGAVLPCVWRNL